MKVIIYCQTDIYNQVYFTVVKQKTEDWIIHKKNTLTVTFLLSIRK